MSATILRHCDGKEECYLCGKQTGLERHHIMPGTANRKLAEKYGLWVLLCNDCHTGKNGAQYDPEKALRLKQDAQRAFERLHGHELWMDTFRKNYL